jgi:transmembrane sensor
MANSLSTDLIDHALSLLAAADIEGPERSARIRCDLDRWQSESPTHKIAYDEALRRWNALGNALPTLRERFREPKLKTRSIRSRNMFCIAVFIAVVALAFAWHARQPIFNRSYQTGTAQIAKLSLPDGSRIDLNAQSALEVRLYRNRRVVEFKGGDARFEVRSDAGKPFQVITRVGMVEVTGTVFTVSDRGRRVIIEVERGGVRFFPNKASDEMEITDGQRLSVQENAPLKIDRYDASRSAEWRDGWLAFDNDPLADAVLAINPYRKKPIYLADGKAGLLRLTGRFRAQDSQSLLAALPKILPIVVIERSDGSVEIRHR